MRVLRYIALILILIGALNWGLVGFFQYDLISNIFGGMMSTGARVVYSLVGIAGLFGIGAFLMHCCGCGCACGCNCGPNCGPNCNCGGKCGGNCNCRRRD